MPDPAGTTLNPPSAPLAPGEEPAKYWAFISYSHRDRKWGEWLHRELETFHVPKRLARAASRRGVIPTRLFPVFRDREELPVSADLGRNIEEALRLSRFLIVICSPGAAKSRWVNEEILTFKRLGRSDRILALIVDGEPNASDGKPGYNRDQECFPEAMRYAMQPDGTLGTLRTEPIAADARPGQDGRENSLLKLLAGLLGVNFDDLRQREHERKIRRLRVIIATTATLLLLFAALGVALYFQRNYAREQRTRAEAALAETRQTLSRSDYLQAVDAMTKGATPEALAYLARAVRTNARNAPATDLFVSLLAYRRWPLSMGAPVPLGKEVGLATFDAQANSLIFAEGVDTWRILNIASGRIATSGPLQPIRLGSAAFSPDGQKVVTISGALGEPGSARVWDVTTGAALTDPFALGAGASFVAMSPDGNTILVSIGELVEGRDLKTGAISAPHLQLDNIVLGASYSPDGTRIAANQLFETVISDATTGQPIGTPWKHDAIPQFYTFAADGKTLGIALGDSTARLWNMESGEPIGEVLKHRSDLTALRFDRAGETVLTAARDATAMLWDARTGSPTMEPMRHSQIVVAAAFAPDEKTVLTVSGGEGKPAQLQRWDIKRDAFLQNVLPHKDRVLALALHPDGQRLATGCADGTIRIWNMGTLAVIAGPAKQDGEISSCVFNVAGTVLASSAGNAAMLWDGSSAKPLTPPLTHNGAVTGVAFSPDGGKILTASMDGTAQLWNAADGKPLGIVLKHDDGVLVAIFSPDGQRILTGSSDKTARLWDARTGKLLGPPMPHEAPVSLARFSADGRTIATASKDGVVRLWDAQTARSLTPPLVHDREITGLIFAADGLTLTTGAGELGGQGSARVWDTRTGQPLTDPMLHPDGVIAVALHPDGHRLATGSFDGLLHVWDYAMARPRFAPVRFEDAIVRLEFSIDGRQLVVASGNAVTLVDLIDPTRPPPEWLIALGERVGGLRLNGEGVLQPVPDRTTDALREMLRRQVDHDDYGRFGRWFFSLPEDNRPAIPPNNSPSIPSHL